ncbi:MAG: hypothetical protein LKI24_09775 [Acidipropionibacterium sp.]|jgi:hypothetical protein|nr:hypothetical protein [Acidipropionibacterium sp.]
MAAVSPHRDPSAKTLTGPEGEHVVAQSGADAEIQTESEVVIGGGADGVQGVDGGHHLRADRQPVGVAKLLVGEQLDRRVADPAVSHAGVGEACDPL